VLERSVREQVFGVRLLSTRSHPFGHRDEILQGTNSHDRRVGADEFRDGQLVFDYRPKPGPVTRRNALELMRAVGLLSDSVKP
jgi:hypothetical protein